ncbi:MAG: hypothetical protein ACRC7C_08015 [Beijerinckiaceae bacterium]
MTGVEHTPTEETRAQVKALAQFVTQADIATFLGISDKTLRKYYPEEIRTGSVNANMMVARRLFEIATKGQGREAVTAMIFWLKTRAQWRETVDVNHQHTFVDGARERLAGKLGDAVPEGGTQSPTVDSPPIGSA